MDHISRDCSIVRSSDTSGNSGFRRAGDVLRLQSSELLVSKRKLRRTEAIQIVREKRETETQNLGFSSRPFVLQVTGHPSYGLPWGTGPPGPDISSDARYPTADSTDHIRERRADAGHVCHAAGGAPNTAGWWQPSNGSSGPPSSLAATLNESAPRLFSAPASIS